MARRRSKYDSACYYDNKLIGRCTVSDGEAYALLMESCGGSAARVLQEYAYFSPELKTILEKVAAIQSKQTHNEPESSLFGEPTQSPWGKVQHCDILCPGVFMVSTEGHGGIMVSKDMTALLSPAAKKCGEKKGGYLCFEEDCQASVVMRELMDKKLWTPDHTSDKAGFEKMLNDSIIRYNPDYWRSRQSGLDKAAARQPVTAPTHVER